MERGGPGSDAQVHQVKAPDELDTSGLGKAKKIESKRIMTGKDMLKFMMDTRMKQADTQRKPRKQPKAVAGRQPDQSSIRDHMMGLIGAGSGVKPDSMRVKAKERYKSQRAGPDEHQQRQQRLTNPETENHSEEGTTRGSLVN